MWGLYWIRIPIKQPGFNGKWVQVLFRGSCEKPWATFHEILIGLWLDPYGEYFIPIYSGNNQGLGHCSCFNFQDETKRLVTMEMDVNVPNVLGGLPLDGFCAFCGFPAGRAVGKSCWFIRANCEIIPQPELKRIFGGGFLLLFCTTRFLGDQPLCGLLDRCKFAPDLSTWVKKPALEAALSLPRSPVSTGDPGHPERQIWRDVRSP